MLRAALALKASRDDDQWHSFATTASAVLDGRALNTIPIMIHIVGATIEAWQNEDDILREFGGSAALEIGSPNAQAEWAN
ncbi:MAG: hypothetical protein OXJ64_16125 [Boseongicola sp.]|nr:hypothetical protein [Boseongicola sp.]